MTRKDDGMRSVRVAGLGGSLRAASTSRTALQVALEGAAASGAGTERTR
jgi:NAD(P)H-dependent FMN reductase